MFSEAATRADYLALLTGRSLSAVPRDASIVSLVRLVDQEKPLARAELGRVQARLAEVINGFGVPLSDNDRATIVRFHRRFVDAGLSLRFNSTGRLPQSDYPTYRDLLVEVDRNDVQRNFLAREEDFQFVKSLHAGDRIVPIGGNLAGRVALANVGKYLEATGLRVSAFYTSTLNRQQISVRGSGADVRLVAAVTCDEGDQQRPTVIRSLRSWADRACGSRRGPARASPRPRRQSR
jgi:hypothetical protein